MESKRSSLVGQTLTKGERTAQRILDCAEQLFATRGYRGTTLRHVAEAAGIREPGLYNHFAGKEALYQQVLYRGLQPMVDILDQMLSATNQPANLPQLPDLITDAFANHPHMAALMQQALIGEPEYSPPEIDQWLSVLINKGRQVFDLVGNSELSDADIAIRLVALFNITTGYFVAAPLFQQLTGEDALQGGNLERQKQLLGKMVRLFLVD